MTLIYPLFKYIGKLQNKPILKNFFGTGDFSQCAKSGLLSFCSIENLQISVYKLRVWRLKINIKKFSTKKDPGIEPGTCLL